MDLLDHASINNEQKDWSGGQLRNAQNTTMEQKSKAARRSGGEAWAPRSMLRLDLQEVRRWGSKGRANDEVAKKSKITRKALPRLGSHGTPEGMRVVEKDVWRKGSTACLERTRSDSTRMRPVVDRKRDSSGRVGSGGVAGGEESVEIARPWRGSKRKPEGIRCSVAASAQKRGRTG